MRVGTWNVLHGAHPVDGAVDVERFARAVKDLDLDVLGLQELDRGQPRSGGADLPAVAAAAMGATVHRFAPTLLGLPGEWGPPPEPGADDGRQPAYGVALLSRLPVSDWRVVALPRLPRDLPLLLGRPRRLVVVRDEPRVALAARVETSAGPVTVVTTHLTFIPGWNLLQLRRLVRRLPSDVPLVVTGDLNLGRRRARVASGLRPLAEGRTFPADVPRRQLDHLLGRGVQAADPEVRHLPLSDHRALTATVVPTG